MPQPDLALFADSLHTLPDQVALVPNIAGLGSFQHVANLEQRIGALDRQVTNNHRVLLETISTNQL